jgi:pimeloyl-ACP methyl ester carboxylesterase
VTLTGELILLLLCTVWLNDVDQRAGSVQPKELYFRSSSWQYGGTSVGPALNKSITAYSIMDNFTDMLFNKAIYPNLNQVVIAGHSMGGQAVHRYALLKKQKSYDDNMSFWVGNPG